MNAVEGAFSYKRNVTAPGVIETKAEKFFSYKRKRYSAVNAVEGAFSYKRNVTAPGVVEKKSGGGVGNRVAERKADVFIRFRKRGMKTYSKSREAI